MKGAVVDLADGSLTHDRLRVDTPQPATPEAMAEALVGLIEGIAHEGPIGIGFPAVVRHGEVFSANNIDRSWIGRSVVEVFSEATGQPVVVVNDADAAAMAEAAFGAAQGVGGMVLMITFGTGIGSGLLVDGKLVPNLELGIIELDGHYPAELHFSAKARRKENLGWDDWGDRANRFLTHVYSFLSPELIVVGGGVAKRFHKFSGRLDPDLPVVPARMGNSAGLVGAALLAMRSQTG